MGPAGALFSYPIHTQWRGGAAHGRVLITAAMTPSRVGASVIYSATSVLFCPICSHNFNETLVLAFINMFWGVYGPSLFSLATLAFPVQWINHCAKSWCSYAVARNIKDTAGLTRTTGDLKNGNRRIYNSCVLVIMGKYYWPMPRQLYVILVYQNLHITCIFIEHAWLMLTDNWHHIMVSFA